MGRQIGEDLGDEIGRRIGEEIGRELGEEIGDQIGREMEAELDGEVGAYRPEIDYDPYELDSGLPLPASVMKAKDYIANRGKKALDAMGKAVARPKAAGRK
eukprot:TRINITY_DN15686_c0_g1_i1.p3 TRINITY_DN15686_c0_g1~~TRINITY_DN15686_c0_g1_i1.p3  ORF type:complete len:101 (+),score=32.62 TRINITY_DN15686_c0_g1_i1:415-717(+)